MKRGRRGMGGLQRFWQRVTEGLEIKQAGNSQMKLASAIAKGQHSIRVVQKVSAGEVCGGDQCYSQRH